MWSRACRSAVLGAAVLALLTLVVAPSASDAKRRPRLRHVVTLRYPSRGDITVAQMVVVRRKAARRSGAARVRLPRVRLLHPRKRPKTATVYSNVRRIKRRKRSFVLSIAIVNRKKGASRSALGAGPAQIVTSKPDLVKADIASGIDGIGSCFDRTFAPIAKLPSGDLKDYFNENSERIAGPQLERFTSGEAMFDSFSAAEHVFVPGVDRFAGAIGAPSLPCLEPPTNRTVCTINITPFRFDPHEGVVNIGNCQGPDSPFKAIRLRAANGNAWNACASATGTCKVDSPGQPNNSVIINFPSGTGDSGNLNVRSANEDFSQWKSSGIHIDLSPDGNKFDQIM